jgi:transposase
MKKREKRKRRDDLDIINPDAAGIDIGSSIHYVAVSENKDSSPVREFGTTTKDLEAILQWLLSLAIKTVAMESTGIYWIPLYDILESHGIEVYLVNARHLKNVSGKKNDADDSDWIRKLHSYGLLNRSFIPNELTRKLRSYVRQRESMETLKAKDLTQIGMIMHTMNIKLQNIVSSLEGVSSMNIIRAIVSGENSPEELIKYWSTQMKASSEEAQQSLKGNYKEENIFILSQALSSYDFHKSQMLGCELKIEEVLLQMSAISVNKEDIAVNSKSSTNKKKRKARKNEYNFDAVEYLKNITGVDLTAVDGFDVNTILAIISETGTDMSKFKTAKHFVSWLRLCPNPKISGGKIIGYKKNTTSSRAAKAFRLSAQALHSSKGYLGYYFRKVAYKRGNPVAIKALARKLAIIFYYMLSRKQEYVKLNIEEMNKKNKKKILSNLETKAKNLGYKLVKEVA